MQLPAPMPRMLYIGFENTGNCGGTKPCGAQRRFWLSAISNLL